MARVKIQHLHSTTASTLNDINALVTGEIAVIATKGKEKLVIKNSSNEKSEFSSDAIVLNSATTIATDIANSAASSAKDDAIKHTNSSITTWVNALTEGDVEVKYAEEANKVSNQLTINNGKPIASGAKFDGSSALTINIPSEPDHIGAAPKGNYIEIDENGFIVGDLKISGTVTSTMGFYEDPEAGEPDGGKLSYATETFVENTIDSRLDNIDANVGAESGYYITGIVQENGKITRIDTEKLPDATKLGTLTGVTVVAGEGLTDGGTISATTGSNGGTITLNIGEGTGITVTDDAVSISDAYQKMIASGASAYTQIQAFLKDASMTGSAIDTLVEIQNYINSDSGATSQLLDNVSTAQNTANSALTKANEAMATATTAYNWGDHADVGYLTAVTKENHYKPTSNKPSLTAGEGRYIASIQIDDNNHITGITTGAVETFTEQFDGTVKSVTVKGANGLTGSGTVETTGTITISGATATSGNSGIGVSKLITGDLNARTYADGEAAAASHSHSQYTNQNAFGKASAGGKEITATSVTDTLAFNASNGLDVSVIDNKLNIGLSNQISGIDLLISCGSF